MRALYPITHSSSTATPPPLFSHRSLPHPLPARVLGTPPSSLCLCLCLSALRLSCTRVVRCASTDPLHAQHGGHLLLRYAAREALRRRHNRAALRVLRPLRHVRLHHLPARRHLCRRLRLTLWPHRRAVVERRHESAQRLRSEGVEEPEGPHRTLRHRTHTPLARRCGCARHPCCAACAAVRLPGAPHLASRSHAYARPTPASPL